MRIKRDTDPPKKQGTSALIWPTTTTSSATGFTPRPPQSTPVKSGVATSVLRNAIPLPLPAAQLAASTITRDNRLGWENLHPSEQYELARSVINARARTGQDRGGTEYVDYSPEVEKDINNLSGSFWDAALGSVFSPEFRTATTMGRVSYEYNPETDVYTVRDSYDFSPASSKKTAYAAVRSAAGQVGITEGKPNVVATFKGSDYSGPRPEGGSTYKEISDFNVSQEISNRLDAIGDVGKQLYDKIYGTLSRF